MDGSGVDGEGLESRDEGVGGGGGCMCCAAASRNVSLSEFTLDFLGLGGDDDADDDDNDDIIKGNAMMGEEGWWWLTALQEPPGRHIETHGAGVDGIGNRGLSLSLSL